jgi:hypothetical protein
MMPWCTSSHSPVHGDSVLESVLTLSAPQFRGYGHLYGYPDDGGEMGPGKDREFMQIPTYVAPTGRFTYAVPLDHVPTTVDRALADRAGRILAAYEERRLEMDDADDMVELLLRLNARFERLSIIERTRTDERTVVSPQ